MIDSMALDFSSLENFQTSVQTIAEIFDMNIILNGGSTYGECVLFKGENSTTGIGMTRNNQNYITIVPIINNNNKDSFYINNPQFLYYKKGKYGIFGCLATSNQSDLNRWFGWTEATYDNDNDDGYLYVIDYGSGSTQKYYIYSDKNNNVEYTISSDTLFQQNYLISGIPVFNPYNYAIAKGLLLTIAAPNEQNGYKELIINNTPYFYMITSYNSHPKLMLEMEA
jgi:hypothetical protein